MNYLNLGNVFDLNRLNGIDTSRSNMNRILNPSIRNYPVEEHNTVKLAAQAQEKTTVESLEERRKSGTGIDATAAGTAGTADMAGMAVEAHVTDIAGKADVTVGTQVPGQNKREACSTDSEFKLDFTSKGLLNGIIMAEVLGKPKYFRRGR